VEICFSLKGLEKEAYDENEIYVSGIDPTMIIGAEQLPGDWDVKRLEIIETAPTPVEEEEVDYDEQKEALNDD
jgi:DNA topoisomerase-6 subunit B